MKGKTTIVNDRPDPVDDPPTSRPKIATAKYKDCSCREDLADWKYHEETCHIWKNGRIAELEEAAKDFCKWLEGEPQGICDFEGQYYKKFKELLKQPQGKQ